MAKQRLEEIRKIRLEKAKKLRELEINPYPSKVKGKRILISMARESLGKKVGVAGRVWSIREHGSCCFLDIKDETGDVQLFVQSNKDKNNFEVIKLLDIGDFLWVEGKVIKTKSGEITTDVDDIQVLTKSIRPIPSTWYKLKDTEERYRQRYVDLLLNDELKDLFRKKAVFWNSIRDFMLDKGFIEVETPVLENTAGGADANPFATHHDALDIDLYLRISMGELWQKRLMVAGFEKTFEIGRQFRNEGISREHLQDYTQMEFYWAFANYEDSMKLVEELYKYTAKKTFGKSVFEISGKKIDISKKWGEIDYSKTLLEKAEIDVGKITVKELKDKLKKMGIKYNQSDTKGRLTDLIWKEVRKSVVGPVFLVGHPVEVSPLSKRMSDRPDFTERYQVIIAGSELGNGYSELNDPVDQANRFSQQQKMRDEGDSEAQMHDADFVRALEYGVPPVTGFGVSERLFAFLADKPVRETVLFPLLRPKK